MRRTLLLAFVTTALLGACGSKKTGGVSAGDDSADEELDGGGTKLPDGGKKPPRGGDDDEDDDTDDDDTSSPGGGKDGGFMYEPTSTDFKKDATGGSGLTPKVVDELKKGSKTCSAKMLYPYEGTVFPAGLTPPTIMWEGASDAAYIKLTFDRVSTLEYEYAIASSPKGELRIPADDWLQITRRTQGTPLSVTLTSKSGDKISTCQAKWRIAQGAMTGTIYYNTYNHPAKNGQGAVMRLTLGSAESEVYLSFQGPAIPSTGPCISCHSVSFNGTMIAASTHNYAPVVGSFETSSYGISQMPEPRATTRLPESTFGAFSPDGKKMLSMGNPDCTAGADSFPRSPNNFPLVAGPSKVALHDTSNGQVIPTTGLEDDWYMWMPQFSPKGDKVVFNHAKPGMNGTDRRELAIMDFDPETNAFSKLRVLVSKQGPEPSIDYRPNPSSLPIPTGNNGCTTPVSNAQGAIPGGTCTEPCYPAWPFFTPNGEGIVYSMVSEPDFMLGFPGREKAAKSELWYVDVASGKSVRLDRANKGMADGDSLANYYPTVLPVSIGGYYWVFWTSTRNWGHREFGGSIDQLVTNPFGGTATLEAFRKRIWVTALRAPMAGVEGASEEVEDLSAPAFYLEGQANTGNVRAFAALNPCRAAGKDCTSGLDCCTGYCDIEKGAEKGQCTEVPPPCAKQNERCAKDSDCCAPESDADPELSCLGNFCGFRAAPQ
jgi:hypothetical protein